MHRSALIAGILGALTLFAVVAGAYVVTGEADTADACRYRTNCDSGWGERDEDECTRPLAASRQDDCRPEPPICQLGLDECCEVIPGSIETSDLCEPPPACDQGEGSECCLPGGGGGGFFSADVGCLPGGDGGAGGASIGGDCCQIGNPAAAGECEPPCFEDVSISSGDCGCMVTRGASISGSGCNPRDDDHCERRSFRRIGRWPAQDCQPL